MCILWSVCENNGQWAPTYVSPDLISNSPIRVHRRTWSARTGALREGLAPIEREQKYVQDAHVLEKEWSENKVEWQGMIEAGFWSYWIGFVFAYAFAFRFFSQSLCIHKRSDQKGKAMNFMVVNALLFERIMVWTLLFVQWKIMTDSSEESSSEPEWSVV